MCKLYIVRHGNTDFNDDGTGSERIRGWIDIPLNEQGIHEAQMAAQVLKGQGVECIYASSLQRTVVTSQVIADFIGLDRKNLIFTDSLRPWNLGDLQGQPCSEIAVDMEFYTEHPKNKVPGGESYQDFIDRYVPFLKEQMDETITSGMDRALVTHYRNLKLAEDWQKSGFKNVDPTTTVKGFMPTGEILVFTHDGTNWSIEKIDTHPNESNASKVLMSS